MSKPFLSDDVDSSVLQALQNTEERLAHSVAYCAHLGALLREACDILEKQEVEIEVSEPLQFWWEREKRRREAKASGVIVAGSRGPVRDRSESDSGTGVSSDPESAANEGSVQLLEPEGPEGN